VKKAAEVAVPHATRDDVIGRDQRRLICELYLTMREVAEHCRGSEQWAMAMRTKHE
jgi:hypothetical protein